MILSFPLDLFEELHITDNNSCSMRPTQQPKRFHLNFVISFSGDNKHIFRGRKTNLVTSHTSGLGDDSLHVLNLSLATGEGTEL
jgi:hypothetical protein